MQFIRSHKSSFFITLIVILLFVTNYVAGTYVSGWDSLQTELSPWLGVKRAFFSVWEEYQSFGLTAGMGHAADLVRALYVWIISFVLPQSIVRYFTLMTCVLVGALGMLQLLRLLGFKKHTEIFSTLGALFYILNYASVQILFVPFEAFSWFFGFLPWLSWIFIKVITTHDHRIRYGMLFLVINILATPAFVAQQLFVVYMLILGVLTLGFLISFSEKKSIVYRGISVAVLIVIINSFWLLPQLYFLATYGSVVREAKMNQLATEDVLYNNLDKGTLLNFVTLTGFF
jgi:hypothetical protein